MTPSLRSRVVEAGARALAESYSPDIGVLPWEQQAPYWRKQAEAGLDAFLDCLTENADETIHPRYNDELNPWRLFDASVEDLLAVLRNPE